MKASDLLVSCLEGEGVTHIFGVPGEENLDLLESLRTSAIKFVVTRHEQSAGFMASTVGRLTGKTGVCLSTVGPGATNFVTAVAYAYLGGMPMLFITGQKPVSLRRQGLFQVVDTIEMMNPVTKFNRQIVHPSSIPFLVAEAFRQAEEERPGPVHLELPEDVAGEEASGSPLVLQSPRLPVPSESSIRIGAEMIEKARTPLLLIGAGANRKEVRGSLVRFVETTGIPFFNTQMGKGGIREDHPLFLGTAALSSGDFIHCAIDRADLIINVGHDPTEKPPFIMGRDEERKVIHLSCTVSRINEVYFPHHEIVGDVSAALDLLAGELSGRREWDFSYVMKIKKYLDEHIREGTDRDRYPLLPQKIVSDVRKAMRDEDIVTLDNGMYKIWFARNYPALSPNSLLLDNALASMGAGLPSAIAAKIVSPGKRVLCVAGDGGFMMNSQEMETAIRLGLDLVVLVLRDDGYGMIEWKQESMGYPSFGLRFGNPDFVSYARSYGAGGRKLKEGEDLARAIEDAFSEGGVQLIEVPVDYSENRKVFDEELARKTCLL
ncbi:MAG: acetolactate synthase large subunit [Deltaproteobacteria bacterium]|nr:MAG: acetolactate synthase large subunit [Deltaproteobacteria bacterium]